MRSTARGSSPGPRDTRGASSEGSVMTTLLKCSSLKRNTGQRRAQAVRVWWTCKGEHRGVAMAWLERRAWTYKRLSIIRLFATSPILTLHCGWRMRRGSSGHGPALPGERAPCSSSHSRPIPRSHALLPLLSAVPAAVTRPPHPPNHLRHLHLPLAGLQKRTTKICLC